MICTSTEQMNRVALAGAAKMTAQGYRYEAVEGVPGWFDVILPADRTKSGEEVRYFVNLLDGSSQDCTCAFHKGNRPTFHTATTCKHAEYVRLQEASNAEYEAREIAREEFENEYADNASRADWLSFTPCHLAGATA